MSTHDIALQIMLDRGANFDDYRTLKHTKDRCSGALQNQRIKGVVKSISGPGMYNLWVVVQP